MKLVINSPKYGKHTVLYDAIDHELISKYNWHLLVDKRFKVIYAITNGETVNGKRAAGFSMHLLILNFPKSGKIDHKNFNGLDNRRRNLRICSDFDSARHTRKPKNNTSGFKGVSFHRASGKYQSRIGFNYTEIRLGLFSNPVDAAKAYNIAAIKKFGQFANLNKLP